MLPLMDKGRAYRLVSVVGTCLDCLCITAEVQEDGVVIQ